jgi:hypothetical protein
MIVASLSFSLFFFLLLRLRLDLPSLYNYNMSYLITHSVCFFFDCSREVFHNIHILLYFNARLLLFFIFILEFTVEYHRTVIYVM